MKKKKIKLGIDLNEVIRAKWLQFDRYYVEEFGTDGVPEQPYVYDLFKNYEWKDTVETNKTLKEDFPEEISPLDYEIDPETGVAPADAFLFDTRNESLTAREVFKRFMYVDYLMEIHGTAPMLYKNQDVDHGKFYVKYKDYVDFEVVSKENYLTIPPTLFFLSKTMSRFNKYRFIEEKNEIWDGVDILITTDPEILDAGTPEGKKVIKLNRPFNVDSQDGEITKLLQINDLMDNVEFEKLIGFEKNDEITEIEKL